MAPAVKSLEPGTLVNVVADDGRSFGTGYFNPASLIAVRLLDPKPDAEIGEDFFVERLTRALARRAVLFDKPFYRLVHAEGDGLPGLTIDRFGDTYSLQFGTAGMEKLEVPLLSALKALLSPECIVLRNDAPSRAQEGLKSEVRLVLGDIPGRLPLEENGTVYFADIRGGQKTGWYYDQRDNRAFVASLAKGSSMLDAYSYAGGFGMAAARSGAREVIAVDSSQPALALAEEAAAANRVSGVCKFVKADAMEELERLGAANETFDVVVADPPPFVRAKKDLEPGAKAYRKLARLSASVTASGGFMLIASCSHNISMERFALECGIGIQRAGRTGAIIRQAGAGPDHPVHPALPETAYLKAIVYAID